MKIISACLLVILLLGWRAWSLSSENRMLETYLVQAGEVQRTYLTQLGDREVVIQTTPGPALAQTGQVAGTAEVIPFLDEARANHAFYLNHADPYFSPGMTYKGMNQVQYHQWAIENYDKVIGVLKG